MGPRRPGSIGNTGCGRYFDKELGSVQHDLDGGPGGFVGGEKFAVLLVVGRKVLASSQMGQHRENMVERRSRGFQNYLDSLKRVAGLLANIPANLAGQRVPACLTGYEHQISEPRGRREVGIRRGQIHLNNFFFGHRLSE